MNVKSHLWITLSPFERLIKEVLLAHLPIYFEVHLEILNTSELDLVDYK